MTLDPPPTHTHTQKRSLQGNMREKARLNGMRDDRQGRGDKDIRVCWALWTHFSMPFLRACLPFFSTRVAIFAVYRGRVIRFTRAPVFSKKKNPPAKAHEEGDGRMSCRRNTARPPSPKNINNSVQWRKRVLLTAKY